MPIYEYKRPDGSTFEVQQSFSDAPLSVDPQSGVPVERVLHAPAVHFKGKGFYATDYGKRGARPRESGESGDGAQSAEKGAGKGSSSDGASGAEKKPATESSGKESPAAKANGSAAAGSGQSGSLPAKG